LLIFRSILTCLQRSTPVTEVKTTCPYCGVGCGVLATTDGAQIVSVRGDPDHPANFGKLCSKGSTLHLTARAGGRITAPQVRVTREAARVDVTWDTALNYATEQFARIIETHGPDAVAFYGSGQLLTEDYYALNKLARAVVGTNNIDTNSRLCMSSAVAGYKATLGADAVPTCYEDIDHADLLFIAGSNTAWAHPIVFRRIEAAREKRPTQKMIVVDPRRTETAAQADLHLAILPGTDVALFHAMLHWLIWEERVNLDYIAAHTEGFAALKTLVRELSPAVAARICGVPEKDIITAARWWAEAGNVLSLYCQGLNQSTSGTDKNASLVGLHLATAQIGKPGAGPFSLTGQPNAMGGREVGALCNLLPGHREAANAVHRNEVAAFWGVPALSDRPGKSAVEMFEAMEKGEIKAVWIACTNPAHSMPDLARVHAALRACELVIVQEAFASSETVAFADVVLPATTWGEKTGTVTNSERRITRVNAVLPPAGEARHDWAIFCAVGARLQARLQPNHSAPLMAFATPQSLWEEHRALTAGRDLDITALTYATLEQQGAQQWPYTQKGVNDNARLYTDHRFATASGKAQFVAAPFKAVSEKTSAKFPLALTTGRMRDQWHTMTRTGRSAQAFGHETAPQVEMNSHDLARRAMVSGAWARVRTARGSVIVRASASESVRSGQIYLPMHWGQNFLRGRDNLGINALTTSAFCPKSKQPELKHNAAHVEAFTPAWSIAAFARLPAAQLDSARLHWLDQCDGLDVAFVVPIEGEVCGLWLEAASLVAPTQDWLTRLDASLFVPEARVLRYDDAVANNARRVAVKDDCVVGARLSGASVSPAASAWLKGLLLARTPVQPLSRWLLAPSPPDTFTVRESKTICSCFGVSETDISQALVAAQGDAPTRLAHVQRALQCGTNCGSCVPELKRLATQCVSAPAGAPA
jgi:assimilatory nitrate reductase catalytic subunit